MVTPDKDFKDEFLNSWSAGWGAAASTTAPPTHAALEMQGSKTISTPRHSSSTYKFIIEEDVAFKIIAATGYQIHLISFFYVVFVSIFMYKFKKHSQNLDQTHDKACSEKKKA